MCRRGDRRGRGGAPPTLPRCDQQTRVTVPAVLLLEETHHACALGGPGEDGYQPRRPGSTTANRPLARGAETGGWARAAGSRCPESPSAYPLEIVPACLNYIIKKLQIQSAFPSPGHATHDAGGKSGSDARHTVRPCIPLRACTKAARHDIEPLHRGPRAVGAPPLVLGARPADGATQQR